MAIIAVAVILTVLSTAGAADDAWLDVMRRGRQARVEHDFAVAEKAFRDALVVVRGDPGSLKKVIVTLQALGEALARQARSMEAERAYEEAVQLSAKLPASDFGIRSEALKGLAWFYAYTQRWTDASRVHQEQLSLVEDRYGGGSMQAAAIRHAIAQLATLQGDYTAAIAGYEMTLRVLAPLGMSDAPGRALASNQLAFLAGVQNRDAERRKRETEAQRAFQSIPGDAVAVLSQSVRVREQSFGRQHPALIAPLLDLAGALTGVGRLEEADSVRERIIDVVIEAGLHDARVLATVLEQRAGGLEALGRRDPAKLLRAQASALRTDAP